MLIYEKESGRIVKFLDREVGAGPVWQGLRKVHFMNGDVLEADQVGTLVRCRWRPKAKRPWFHADGCRYEHAESVNPKRRNGV